MRVPFPPWTDGSAHDCFRSRSNPSSRPVLKPLGSKRAEPVFLGKCTPEEAERIGVFYDSAAACVTELRRIGEPYRPPGSP